MSFDIGESFVLLQTFLPKSKKKCNLMHSRSKIHGQLVKMKFYVVLFRKIDNIKLMNL